MGGVAGGGKLDLNAISADEVLVESAGANSGRSFVKSEVGEKIYNINGYPYIVIKFSDACVATLSANEAQYTAAFLAWGTAINQTKAVADGGTVGSSTQTKFICGVPQEAFLKEAQKGVSASDMNSRRLYPPALYPTAAVIPMRSNIDTYGPYVSANFFTSAGGTNIEQNTDLAPWVFGGTSVMNAAGLALANSYQTALNQAESGSVTLPGPPDLVRMGYVAGGPNLTGINVSFGSSGVTTNYNFQTYTPKFGALTRAAVDQLKNVAKNRQKQLQFLRNQAIMAHNINRKLKRVGSGNGGRDTLTKNSVADSQTLHRVIVGEMFDWYQKSGGNAKRTVVGLDTLSKSVLELRYDYEKKAFMSFDGLFGPISKTGGGANLPQYAKFNENTPLLNRTKGAPLAPQPPFAIGGCDDSLIMDKYNLPINRKYSDPLTNKVTSSDHHHEGDGAGHSIDLLGRGTDIPEKGMLMNMIPQDDASRYSEDYRFLGLRGPLVLHAWGYDTDGKPVPNLADSDSNTVQGTFKSTDLKDKFLKDWLNKPHTWPVAPVDLRFDRERGMWVSPQAYKIVVAKIIKKVEAFGEGRAVLINTKGGDKYYKDLYDENGQKIAAADPGDVSCEANLPPKEQDKQYEWVVVNAGKCEQQYYCFAISDNYSSTECKQANAINEEGFPGYLHPTYGFQLPIFGPYTSCAGNPCKHYGSCCYETEFNVECADQVEKQDCLEYYKGDFKSETEGGTCEHVAYTCQRLGSCCYYDNEDGSFYGCDDNIPQKACERDGGVHWFGSSCSSSPCNKTNSSATRGACCYDTGYGPQCDSDVEKQDCIDYYGGVPYPGRTCDEIDFLCVRKGACCYYDKDDGSFYGCDDNIPEWTCNNETGVHHFGATCSETHCPDTETTTTSRSPTTPNGTTTTGGPCVNETCVNEIFDKVWKKILEQSVNCGSTSPAPSTTSTTTTTPEPRVPGPPTNLKAETVGGEIVISWSPPSDQGEPPPVTGYKVTWTPGNGSVNNGANDTNAVITNPDPDVTYSISVVATNATGDSTPATIEATLDRWCCVKNQILGDKCYGPGSTECTQPGVTYYNSQSECEAECIKTTTSTTTGRPSTTTTTTSTRPPRTAPPTPAPPPPQPPVPPSDPGTREPAPNPPGGGGGGNAGSGQSIIKVVDRIGRSHNAGSLIYAYYDTYKSEYIVLENYEEQSAPTIFGQWVDDTVKVEGTVGLSSKDNINIGSSVQVVNRLNLEKPLATCTVRAVAIKFLKSSNGRIDPNI